MEQGKRLPGTEAALTRRSVICPDMLNDERYTPWKEDVELAGLHGTIALPLLHEDRLFGVLCVYFDLVSLFDADDARSAVESMTVPPASMVIPNMVSLQALEYMTERLRAQPHAPMAIIVNDPTIALLAGEPIAVRRWMDGAAGHGMSIGYRHAIRAAAMTVNPFYPCQHDHAFMPAYIDKDSLLHAVSAAVDVPVYNIMDEGAASALYELLLL